MRRSLPTFAVLLLVVSAGCLGFGAQPDRSDRAEATLDQTRAAIQDVESYRVQTQMHVAATAEGESVQRDVDVEGTVDVDDRMLVTNSTMEDQTYTSYLSNTTGYRACPSPWGWGKESVDPRGDWLNVTPLGRQVRLLDSGDLRLETGGSVPEGTVALVGQPSTDALEEYSEEGVRPVLGGPSVENFTVRVVIDNRTHRPVSSTISFEIAGGGGSGSASMETTFEGYNEPVSISIPTEVTEDPWETGCPGS